MIIMGSKFLEVKALMVQFEMVTISKQKKNNKNVGVFSDLISLSTKLQHYHEVYIVVMQLMLGKFSRISNLTWFLNAYTKLSKELKGYSS